MCKMKTIFEQIGEKIASWLDSQGETQSFFAERMGVSKQVMSKIVNGKKAINIDEITKIAGIIGVTVDELLKPKDIPQVIQEPILFMIGKLEKENTKEGLQFLNHVMNEMIELEEILHSK
jgi:transcriptional regulator with XRE-family HTH domain